MEEEKPNFNYKEFEQEAIKQLQGGKPLEGKDGVLAPLIKRLVEAGLNGEMDAHLIDSSGKNRRNGKTGKQVKTAFGKVEIDTPRDRNSSFEPQLLPKRQTTLGEALDHKVISLYGRGMSYSDICKHLEELYGLTVSPSTLSLITDRIIEDVKAWQNRPLESVYPFMWLDAIHYKVKEDGAIKTKAVYCLLGVNREGIKDLLGLYISDNEGARFWLNVLTDIQNRGVKDIIVACIDNLKGFAQAIETIFPQTEVQLCLVHQIRSSTRFVAIKDVKQVMKDLKEVYQAASKEQAEKGLASLQEQWGAKYPSMIRSWFDNWERLSNYFKYPKDIRRIIYTTNIIESFHSQLRKVTKSKRVFTSDMSLLKLLYLVQGNLKENWTGPMKGWKLTYAQMMILFEERMTSTD
ncbi:MAG TPA: IS256 family transposase [Saprospiraceae bacterium]|nr:IS256 family transposase [Saprospiraceae bacterium]